jgi:hypothetical protein
MVLENRCNLPSDKPIRVLTDRETLQPMNTRIYANLAALEEKLDQFQVPSKELAQEFGLSEQRDIDASRYHLIGSPGNGYFLALKATSKENMYYPVAKLYFQTD